MTSHIISRRVLKLHRRIMTSLHGSINLYIVSCICFQYILEITKVQKNKSDERLLLNIINRDLHKVQTHSLKKQNLNAGWMDTCSKFWRYLLTFFKHTTKFNVRMINIKVFFEIMKRIISNVSSSFLLLQKSKNKFLL